MNRTKLLLGSYILFILAACNNSSSSQGTRFDSGMNPPSRMDGSVEGDSGDRDGDGNDDKKDGGGGLVVPPPKDAGSSSSSDKCIKACEPGNCGKVPDGCGKFLECGDCGSGMICGATEINKCGFPRAADCTPKTAAELCTGRCGAVSDGCSSVVMCNAASGGVTCKTGELCIEARCTASTPVCKPATCDELQHECGPDGDGCGGTVSCGTCSGGYQCSYSSEGNKCVPAPPPVTCTPLTQQQACDGTCGSVSDNCGAVISCPCPNGQTCGGDGTPGQCGTGGQTCVPIAASAACDGKCGEQGDGCSGSYICDNSNGGQTCAVDETCGGGGVPNKCGKMACMPRTQSEACPGADGDKSCGSQPDNCGGLIDCGDCPQDQRCGLTTRSICGKIPVCQATPIATACAGKCGSVPDGCGGVYQCMTESGGVTCTGNEYCGANNQPNHCGIPPISCVAKTCGELMHTCGLASDGCGRVLNCWPECSGSGSSSCQGSCGSSAACLANKTTGVQSCVSGAPPCTGSLCSSVPSNCASNSPTTLTGTVRTPGRLENTTYNDQLPVPNALVYIPADTSTSLPDIFEGVNASNSASCGRCGDEKLVADGQSVLAAAVTDYKGEFVLTGRIPVGVAFNLVVKVGKWRRVVQVPGTVAASCATRSLDLQYTRLATDTSDGLTGTHLPKIAVSTGSVDAMECVLRGIGISESQFTLPSGTGRIHMYRVNGARMSNIVACAGNYTQGNNTRTCTASRTVNNVTTAQYGCVTGQVGCSWKTDGDLYASQNAINAYDMVVFDCEGAWRDRDAGSLGRLLSYANAGGRVFASHWAYDWLSTANSGSFKDASTWIDKASATSANTASGFISLPTGVTTRAGANSVKSLLYRDWLDYVGALNGSTAGMLQRPTPPLIAMKDARDVAGSSVGSATDEWMYRNKSVDTDPTSTTASNLIVQQLSFNTPYNAAANQICGRVAFSAFHVAGPVSTNNQVFPAECHTGPLTAQEKTLAFMLFDLGACVSDGAPPQPPSCQALTSADVCPGVDDACGFVSDGCGGVVDCMGCSVGNYCDGNLCRPQQCSPQSCASLGYSCGSFPDGCAGVARDSSGNEGCGQCQNGQTCGLNNPGICGGCVQIPKSTACPSGTCGSASDGCGGVYECDPCPMGQVCGGGGPNMCGQNQCTPLSPSAACGTKNCGLVANGCGGTISCGTCTAPDTCGGGGTPNKCGHPTCTPKSIQAACNGLSCGWVSDGCGGAYNCGTCPNGGVCGGSGPNLCGDSCTPTSCSAAAAECGNIADRCGGLINCGPCPSGQVCGATQPNKCGTGTTCTPPTKMQICTRANATCGLVGDGCGGAVDCGTCTDPQKCNGSGSTPNQCSPGTMGCNKLTCQQQNVQCGAASDGCGALMDCGGCPSGSYCDNGKCLVSPG